MTDECVTTIAATTTRSTNNIKYITTAIYKMQAINIDVDVDVDAGDDAGINTDSDIDDDDKTDALAIGCCSGSGGGGVGGNMVGSVGGGGDGNKDDQEHLIQAATTTSTTIHTNVLLTNINTKANRNCSKKPIAYMPTERYAMEYNMNHKNRGMALIFNHEYFDVPDLENRKGTNVDADALKKALKNLDFDVTIYKDCKLRELLEHIERAASLDHCDNDCILVAILSHGEHGYLYAKDVMYRIDTIWHYFTATTCPSLAGKPKLFFIQACRGDRLDPGIKLQKTETDGKNLSSSTSYRIPIHADFLISYSTIPGFYSWRNVTNGSWFIQSLVDELNAHGKDYDLLTLLTFVNQRVALDFESCVPSLAIMDQQKQIPCITSMLTRILRFKDKTHK